MAFKKYPPPRKRQDIEIISISRKQLQLNTKCQRFLKGAEFAELYFDEDTKTIGIKPLTKETRGSVKINIYPGRSIAIISASYFIKLIAEIAELDFDDRNSKGEKTGEKSIQFIAKWDDKNNMITAKLGK